MLVPRAFWRPVGAAVGRVAPGPMRAYYGAVARSYVSFLRRTPGIRALYTYSSFVGGNFRPGRSDVDFVAVTDAPTPASEVELLLRLRGPFRYHQGLLPIDVWELPDAEFHDTAAWVTAMRPRAADLRPARAVSEWRLLGGHDVRTRPVWEPDRRLATVGDYFVSSAIVQVASRRRPGPKLAYELAELERDLAREGIAGAALEDLRRSRARLARGSAVAVEAEAAIHAALRLVDEHRALNKLPRVRPLEREDSWHVPGPEVESVAYAHGLLQRLDRDAHTAVRSATVYRVPLDERATLVLESEHSDPAAALVRWAVSGGGARAARRAGLAIHVLTSALAEDLWRAGLPAYSLVGGGRHLLGEPLAPRIARPARRFELELAHYSGFWGATSLRWTLLGHRRHTRSDRWPLVLAAERRLAAGEPPILDAKVLMREVLELRALGTDDPAVLATLDDRIWARLGLEIWRGWPRKLSADEAGEVGGGG